MNSNRSFSQEIDKAALGHRFTGASALPAAGSIGPWSVWGSIAVGGGAAAVDRYAGLVFGFLAAEVSSRGYTSRVCACDA
jgi:hypothetical protein